MNGWLWLGALVGAAMVLALTLVVALARLGSKRWAALIQIHVDQLEAGRQIASPGLQGTARFYSRELDGLPAPVQRYFRAVLTEGQPIIAAATIEMVGTINLSATGEKWKPFTSHQRVITQRPGFLWNAQVSMFPGVPAHVLDSYIAGQGQLMAKLLGWFTVAQAQGGGELARGEFMRYFAESVWVPTALLPSQGVQWQAVNETSANATIVDGPLILTLLFTFNDAGHIATVYADSRGAGVGKDMVMLPWECRLTNYQRQNDMLVPLAGEVAWIRPEGRRAYFFGQVKKLHYEFPPLEEVRRDGAF